MKLSFKKYFRVLFMLVCYTGIKAQSINNQVINSAGGGGAIGSTGYEIYYNIGETVINTINSTSNTVTQGFLQPEFFGNYGLTVSSAVNDISCIGKIDGAIILTPTVNGISTGVSYSYFWTPASLCPANDCKSIDSLKAGTYSVTVIATWGTRKDTVIINNIVINDNNSPCLLEVFNGVTPNGDGNNDFFYLKNIDQYPNNRVTIYNRWGQQLYDETGYDNINKKWAGTTLNNNPAPSGTYYYIIDLMGDGSSVVKGWLELLNK